MTSHCYIGVDPGRFFHGIVIQHADGTEVARRRVPNDETAFASFLAEVETWAIGAGETPLWILECRGGDAVMLTTFLLAHHQAVTALTVHEVAAHRKGRPQAHKTDFIDAWLCCELVRRRSTPPRLLQPIPQVVEELRALTRYQGALIADQTRLINRLRFLLTQYYPEYLQARLFGAVEGDTSLAFLQAHPTPSAALALGVEGLAAFLRQHRYRRQPYKKAQELQGQLQGIRTPRPLEAVYAPLVVDVVTHLQALKASIAKLDGEIERRFFTCAVAPILLSLPGMSRRTGPRFLAEVGTLDRFDSADALATYAGLTPTTVQSEMSKPIHYLGSRCNHYLRRVMWWVALGSLRTPASRRYYDRKIAEGKSHNQAIIALARCQLRVVWAMVTNGVLFDQGRALGQAA